MTPTELDQAKAVARAATPILSSDSFEQINWEDGDKSFELNNEKALVVVSESNFEKRSDARKVGQYYSHFNPEFCLELLKELKEAREVIEFYGDPQGYIPVGPQWDYHLPIQNRDGGKRARAYLDRFVNEEK